MGPEDLHFSQTLDDASEAAIGTVLEVATMLSLRQPCQLPKRRKERNPMSFWENHWVFNRKAELQANQHC